MQGPDLLRTNKLLGQGMITMRNQWLKQVTISTLLMIGIRDSGQAVATKITFIAEEAEVQVLQEEWWEETLVVTNIKVNTIKTTRWETFTTRTNKKTTTSNQNQKPLRLLGEMIRKNLVVGTSMSRLSTSNRGVMLTSS